MAENKKVNLTITLDEEVKEKITELARERKIRISSIFEEYARTEIERYEAEKAEKNAVQTARQEGEAIARFYFEQEKKEELQQLLNKITSALADRSPESINTLSDLLLLISSTAGIPSETLCKFLKDPAKNRVLIYAFINALLSINGMDNQE